MNFKESLFGSISRNNYDDRFETPRPVEANFRPDLERQIAQIQEMAMILKGG